MMLFRSYTLSWWQVSLLKLSMLALGLAAGSTWPGVFQGWQVALWIVFALPALYLLPIVWRGDAGQRRA